MQPSAGSRATSPASHDGRGGTVGGASNLDDDDSGGGRIVPTLRIGVDGKIVIDESRYREREREYILEGSCKFVLLPLIA